MEENKLNLIVEETEKALKKELACYVWKEQCAYEVKKRNYSEYVILSITPKDHVYPFITCTAIKDVQKLCETSEWKDYMFYGIETYTYTDIHTGEITLPCISVHIYSEKI